MAILYLCTNCCDVVGIKSNGFGENKVGRKYCYGCGCNDDWDLHVAKDYVIEDLVDKANKTMKENPKVEKI